MSFQDKSIQCSDCGTTFTFSAEDQEFFRSKGYTNEPKRCPECRQARKSERYGSSGGGGSYGAPRQMFPATCAECGKSTEVPFQPRGDKPVYCSDCYRKMRPSR
ncbi:MAG: CxxC-x17-CxxC domain-containing protein [Chloroflexota bacterium]